MTRIWNKHKLNIPLKRKVFVGMSGGVDSSVSALLLKKRGYDVTGIFMKCFNIDGCAKRDAEDARRVAERLRIPFYTFDFEEEYKKRVVRYMVEGYKKGITPNPDVMCNKEIKFGMFLDKALALHADYVAMGHYVRLKKYKGAFSVFKAKDENKDQSYFLWTLTQNQLERSLFPLGEYTKPEVRAMAKKANLPTADKKDSQGICFLGDISISDFLKDYIRSKKGKIITTKGEVIGEHEGAHLYTIGQRHGLDLSMKNKALGIKGNHATKAHYVVSKDVKNNIIIVAEGSEDPALSKQEINLTDVHIINPKSSDEGGVLTRVRYRQPLRRAVLRRKNKKTHTLTFKNPQIFVAPGQSAVFYAKNGEMLGGGIIQ